MWYIRDGYRKDNKRTERWKKIVFQQSITPMAVPVKHVDQPRSHIPRTNWQTLGQLKLRADSNLNGTIKTWLMKALTKFRLPDDLVSRLLASIEDATARVLSPDIAEGQFDFLEIVMLVPPLQTSKRHTWGFFRVERASTDPLNESAKGYCVEYYLYLDKQPGE